MNDYFDESIKRVTHYTKYIAEMIESKKEWDIILESSRKEEIISNNDSFFKKTPYQIIKTNLFLKKIDKRYILIETYFFENEKNMFKYKKELTLYVSISMNPIKIFNTLYDKLHDIIETTLINNESEWYNEFVTFIDKIYYKKQNEITENLKILKK